MFVYTVDFNSMLQGAQACTPILIAFIACLSSMELKVASVWDGKEFLGSLFPCHWPLLDLPSFQQDEKLQKRCYVIVINAQI